MIACYNGIEEGKEVRIMNMQEASRIILGLRAAGWDEKSINDFILETIQIDPDGQRYKHCLSCERSDWI